MYLVSDSFLSLGAPELQVGLVLVMTPSWMMILRNLISGEVFRLLESQTRFETINLIFETVSYLVDKLQTTVCLILFSLFLGGDLAMRTRLPK